MLALVPKWSGQERAPQLGRNAQMTATRIDFDRLRPRRVRFGSLTYLGGVALASRDPAFGGFSSLSVDGDRFTLLSDGGNIVRFRMAADWQPRAITFANLPGGPGSGWDKRDRDSESMTIDGASGRAWVAFEGANAIWRYAPGFARAEARVAPAAMAKWKANGGAESLVRLADGRFLTISETTRPKHDRHLRRALMFTGDPTVDRRPAFAFAFAYRPAPGYDPSDAAQLPDGRIVVLERRFALPFAFSARIALIEPAAVRPGATVAGATLARLAPPLAIDNLEGIHAVEEKGSTILWIVSDDNREPIERSLLLKFRLDAPMPSRSDRTAGR